MRRIGPSRRSDPRCDARSPHLAAKSLPPPTLYPLQVAATPTAGPWRSSWYEREQFELRFPEILAHASAETIASLCSRSVSIARPLRVGHCVLQPDSPGSRLTDCQSPIYQYGATARLDDPLQLSEYVVGICEVLEKPLSPGSIKHTVCKRQPLGCCDRKMGFRTLRGLAALLSRSPNHVCVPIHPDHSGSGRCGKGVGVLAGTAPQ